MNYRQAMKGPHAKEYKAAADAEIAQLNNLDVFRYCSYEEMRSIDPLAKPILLWWVLVRKVCAISGKLLKTKGRIYRHGDLEESEMNYDPTKIHSSNVHLDAVKFLLAMAAIKKLEIISMDVSGAFLRSRPTRLTFIKLPSGYKVFDKNNREMVAICTRALYTGARIVGDPGKMTETQPYSNKTGSDHLPMATCSAPSLRYRGGVDTPRELISHTTGTDNLPTTSKKKRNESQARQKKNA